MSQSWNLNGVRYTTGASNAAATDATSVGSLLDVVDAVAADLIAAYQAAPSSFSAQGAGAGAQGGLTALSSIAARLKVTQQKLISLPGVVST